MKAGPTPAEIGLVIYSGVQLAAVHGLTDLFRIADTLAAGHDRDGGPGLRVTHWQPNDNADAVECVYDTSPGGPARPDIILVTLTLVDLPDRRQTVCLADWLRSAHARGAVLGSVCSGVLVLAESGLLSGRSVSTHWSAVGDLAERFPDIEVIVDKRIIDHGDIITAGGFMAWVDLGLKLVDQLLGPAIAAETARFMMVDPVARAQPFFTGFTPRLSHGDAAVLAAQHWVHGRDGFNVTLADMALQAKLEVRTFVRRFAAATGMTPIEYSRSVRMARARELLEFSTRSVNEIAYAIGYADAAAFARVFRKVVGTSPGDFRRATQPAPGEAAADKQPFPRAAVSTPAAGRAPNAPPPWWSRAAESYPGRAKQPSLSQ
jgi:transcriptional regulator GlxA family with amidase domain